MIPKKLYDIFHKVSHEHQTINTKQMHAKITKNLPHIVETLSRNDVTKDGCGNLNTNTEISWSQLPSEVDPSGGKDETAIFPARSVPTSFR